MAFLSRTHRLTLGPLFCALAFMAHAAAASQTYQVTLLSPLTSGGSSQSVAINKAGQVVGVSTTIAGADRAFLWSPTTSNSAIGTMYALSTLNQATGINAAGEVVANSGLSSEHAYLWRGGTLLKLGKLPGFANSFAFGINGFGQIVGVSTTGYAYNFENPRSFLISNGQLIDLGLLSGGSWSIARGINDAGEVYGGADTNGIFWLVAPFLYKDGLMHDMSSQLPGLITAINNAGQLAVIARSSSPCPMDAAPMCPMRFFGRPQRRTA